jgi:hypothetical protein
MRSKTKALLLVLLAGILTVPSISTYAEEVKYPVYSYGENELAAVREWEKKWAGKKIDSANIDEVKEYVPDSMYEVFKNTEKWGKSWFKIVPYEPFTPTPGMINFTRKYAGTAKIGSKNELLNYVSGVPFPSPKNGLEVAYNFNVYTWGDTRDAWTKGWIVDGRLKYDQMKLLMGGYFMYFTGRTDLPPVPAITPNPKDIWFAYQTLQLEPSMVRNTRYFEVKYNDRTRPFDSWLWSPAARRVIRRNASMRQDATSGGDVCAYDNWGWDGAIFENDYKLIGIKEILAVRHGKGEADMIHEPGLCMVSGLPHERCKVYLLEATNKDPYFIYSKMYWYIDVETYVMVYSDRYDRQGKMWKILPTWTAAAKGENGVSIWCSFGGGAIDVQRVHSSLSYHYGKYSMPLSEQIFTLDYMQKVGY